MGIVQHTGACRESLRFSHFLRPDNPDAIDPCVYHAKTVHNINSEPASHGNFAVEVVPKGVTWTSCWGSAARPYA